MRWQPCMESGRGLGKPKLHGGILLHASLISWKAKTRSEKISRVCFYFFYGRPYKAQCILITVSRVGGGDKGVPRRAENGAKNE